ncbi:hypothetical protein HYV49_02830, partial [Candidatus Pacearchaeota archaeon]|nr:hypothetical protein [Candidatus Pacearchaeota archaeon]
MLNKEVWNFIYKYKVLFLITNLIVSIAAFGYLVRADVTQELLKDPKIKDVFDARVAQAKNIIASDTSINRVPVSIDPVGGHPISKVVTRSDIISTSSANLQSGTQGTFNVPGLGKVSGTIKDIAGEKVLVTQDGTANILPSSGVEVVSTVGPNPFGAAPEIPIIGGNVGFFFGHLIQGLFYGALVAGGIQLIGSLIGLDKNLVDSLSLAAFSGIAGGKAVYGLISEFAPSSSMWAQPGWLGYTNAGWASFAIGAGVAFAVFVATYKDESKKIVTFSCLSWEAQIKGEDCEKCNGDPFKPCSEYRCRSLGQACQLLNKGTGNEACAWVNPRDVESPVIDANRNFISLDHSYKDVQIRPPGLGMKVIYDKSSDGCIKAFTPLQFGVVTNEPTQCKIDNAHTDKFDDMAFFFGGSNIFKYNHTQVLSLPSPSAVNSENPQVPDDGIHTLYARCRDANGNFNVDEFAIRICVDKSPDTTAPLIVGTSIRDGSPV